MWRGKHPACWSTRLATSQKVTSIVKAGGRNHVHQNNFCNSCSLLAARLCRVGFDTRVRHIAHPFDSSVLQSLFEPPRTMKLNVDLCSFSMYLNSFGRCRRQRQRRMRH